MGLRGGVAAPRRARLRRRTGVQVQASGRESTDTLAEDEIGLANVILTNGARLYVDMRIRSTPLPR